MTPLRWRFPDASEVDQRAVVSRQIREFWNALTAKGPAIGALFEQREQWDLVEWMARNLEPISSELLWEFGPGVQQQHRLVLTAETRRWLRPLIAEMVKSAPATGFDLFAYRPPASFEQVAGMVEARTGLSLDDLSARAEAGKWGTIDVTLCCAEPTKAHRQAAFMVLEALLGEERLDRWVGRIDVEPGQAEPLIQLEPTFKTLVAERHARLPRSPWCERVGETSWSLLKLEPEPNVWAEQRDLFLGKTVDVELFENSRSGALFSSPRHSAVGEVFAYLKVDGSKLGPGGFEDKAAIEDAIDAALLPRGLGCNIGGGTGLRYSYVDLALTDVDAAIPLIVDAMRKGKLETNAWIQFFDDDLKWEWVGIWPDSPPPPLPSRTP